MELQWRNRLARGTYKNPLSDTNEQPVDNPRHNDFSIHWLLIFLDLLSH